MAYFRQGLWALARVEFQAAYDFSIYTGPFVVWRDQTATIPIALYARASQKQEADAENFLTMLRESVRFFGSYFAYPYPFDKFQALGDRATLELGAS